MTLAHLRAVGLPCTITHGCEEVMNDEFAKGLGIPLLRAIPTAALGGGMYFALAVLSLVRAGADEVADRKLAAIQLALCGMGLAVFLYLTYREAFVIRAWCQWCMASAFIDVILFVFLMARRYSRPPKPEGVGA